MTHDIDAWDCREGRNEMTTMIPLSFSFVPILLLFEKKGGGYGSISVFTRAGVKLVCPGYKLGGLAIRKLLSNVPLHRDCSAIG